MNHLYSKILQVYVNKSLETNAYNRKTYIVATSKYLIHYCMHSLPLNLECYVYQIITDSLPG